VLFRSVDRAVRMLSAAMPCECASQHVAGQTRGRGVAPVPKYRSTQSKIMISITSNRRALGGDAIEASRSTYFVNLGSVSNRDVCTYYAGLFLLRRQFVEETLAPRPTT